MSQPGAAPDPVPAPLPAPASDPLPDPAPDSAAGADDVRELVDVPAAEVVSRATILLMSAAAEKLGLSAEGAPVDLDEARTLITALAGLITAALPDLGLHAAPFRDGLRSLQLAFREASPYPDPVGRGPGEKLTGPVHS